ncbi:hypothetical protein [Streptococcus halotolerans]|uniref:hypothetical protein n=1 Tax=Streptococcus halotolerans TaxID=1814128 RepID=UPI00155EEA9A|nr:hypothetical protein [Streptococcus halotolerans]
MAALSAGMVSGQGYADELTGSDESVVSVMSETAIPNNSEERRLENDTNQDASKMVENTIESTADEKIWSDDKSSLADQTLSEHTAETSNASDLVSESSTQDTKTITDKEVSQFDLWDAVGFDQKAASDPTKIALANFPISTTRSDIPLLISPNVKAIVLEFSGASYYSETDGTLVEKDNRHDLLITYDEVTDTWRGQPYVHQSQMGNSTFVVKSIQRENGSIALYVPVTKEQISVFQKGLYTVTATYSEKLYATVSDWIINTAPTIGIATKTVTAKVDEVVDLLSAVTIFDKEDDFSNSDSYTTRLETLSYENLSTGEITSLEGGTTSVQFRNPGDYRVRISVNDSDGQSAQNEYGLTILPPLLSDNLPDLSEDENLKDAGDAEDPQSPQDPDDGSEFSTPSDDGLIDGDPPVSPEHPDTLSDDKDEIDLPIDEAEVEDSQSPQDPIDQPEDLSPRDDGLIDGDPPRSPELPSTLPDNVPEHPITTDDVEDPQSPQDPNDGSEFSTPSDDGLIDGDPPVSPSHPDTSLDDKTDLPIDEAEVEDSQSPQDPIDQPEDPSPRDDALIDGDPPRSPELPSTLPDNDPEYPITTDDVEDSQSPQDPNDGSEVSTPRDDGFVTNESPISPSHPDTSLDDKDDKTDLPIDEAEVEDPQSPQDPNDGSEVSTPSDDALIDSDPPVSPELPSTLPDNDPEYPITTDEVEDSQSPQDPNDGSEASSSSDGLIDGDPPVLPELPSTLAENDSVNNSDDFDSGEGFIPASYLHLDAVADSDDADETDSRSEEEMEAIESPALEEKTSMIIPVGLSISEDNSSQRQGRWFYVTSVPVVSTSNNLDVSVKIAQKVLERFSGSVYSSEEGNDASFDQSELETMTNDKSQHSAEARKTTMRDDSDIGLFDGTVDNLFSIKKKDDLGSLLVHLLMVIMIIAYSLVGFYFLRKDH